MPKVIIYSKDGCDFCTSTIDLCESKGIEYKELKLGTDYTREELRDLIPDVMTVPQIFVEDELLGGYTEFSAYVNKGDSDAN